MGLANRALQSPPSPAVIPEAALAKTKIAEQLKDKDNRDAYTVFHILASLYSRYKLPLEYGYAEEFVFYLFNQEAQGSGAQFEAALDCLVLSGMIHRENGLIWTSAQQLSVIEPTAGPFFRLESKLDDLKLRPLMPRAWLNLGMLYLVRGQLSQGCGAFMEFLGGIHSRPDQELVLYYLADFVLNRVIPDISEKKEQPATLDAGLFSKITDLVHELFENNENVALLQAIVDAITTKICQLTMSKGVILFQTLDAWMPLVSMSSTSKRILISFALKQVLLTGPEAESSDYVEKIRSLLSLLDSRYIDKAISIDVFDIILLISSTQSSEDDEDALLSVLYRVLFGDQLELPLAQFLQSDLWHQSVSLLLQLAEALNVHLEKEEFLKWGTAVLKLVIREQDDTDESGIVSIWLLKELVANTGTQEEARCELTKLLSNYERHNFNRRRLLFHIYLGPALYYSYSGNDPGPLRNYLQVILKEIEDVATRNNYDASFQVNLVFYLYFLTHLGRSNWMAEEVRSELEMHRAQIDSWLLQHIEELYVADELGLGSSYKDLMDGVANSVSVSAEPVNWDQALCLSYLILIPINEELVNGDADVSELMKECLSFCQISGVAQAWSQHLAGFDVEDLSEQAAPDIAEFNVQDPSEQIVAGLAGINVQGLSGQTTPVSVNLTPPRSRTTRRPANPVTTILMLQRRVELNLADQHSWYLLGLQMINRHDNLSAIRYFQRAITLAPNFLEPYLEIAGIYHKVEKLEQEVKILTAAFEVDNNHFETCIRLARACRDLKDYKSAIKFYRFALKLSGDNDLFNILKEQGDILLIDGQPIDALKSYWYAMSLKPFEEDILIEVLKLLKELANDDQPSEHELEYLGHKISYPHVVKCLMNYLARRVSYPGHNLALVKAYFLVNDFENAWSLLLNGGSPYILLGNSAQTIASLLQATGHETMASFYHGLNYLRYDLYEEAAEKFIDYLKRYPGDAEAHYYLAFCYAAITKIQRELHLLEPAGTSHFNLALKEGLCALFLGSNKQRAHELLGDIYTLRAEANSLFYAYAISHYEEAYFAAFSPSLIIKIGLSRFDRLIQACVTQTSLDIQTYTRQVKAEVLDWLRIHLRVEMDSKSRADIYGALGKMELLAVQALGRWESRNSALLAKIEHYLLNGEDDLRKAIENQGRDFNFYINLGVLYWEWHSWLDDQTEKRVEKIKQAIENWEQAQVLTRNVRLPRTQRVVREEIEIMITSAFKELKQLM